MTEQNHTPEEFEEWTTFFTNELRRKDDKIYRCRFIIVALCIIITMLIISNH